MGVKNTHYSTGISQVTTTILKNKTTEHLKCLFMFAK
jgi:hypothetical protein